MRLIKKHLILLALVMLTGAEKLSAQSSGLQQFDDRVLINLASNRSPEQTDIFLFLSRTHLYVDVGVPTCLMIGGVLGHDAGMRQNAAYIASSAAVTYGLTELIKYFVQRKRPFVRNIEIVPVYRPSSSSFPSGHTSAAFSTATSLSMAYSKWYVVAPAFLWAGSVSYSRMYLGVHYPTDVGSGAFIGAGTALSWSFLRHTSGPKK